MRLFSLTLMASEILTFRFTTLMVTTFSITPFGRTTLSITIKNEKLSILALETIILSVVDAECRK